MESFGNVGKKITLENDNKSVCMIGMSGGWQTAYGSKLIDPNIKETYIWTFTITDDDGSLCIGIDEATSLWTDENFTQREETHNYSYCHNGNIYSHTLPDGESFDKRWSADDIIAMKLDFSKSTNSGTLSFCINDNKQKNWKIAFNDIPKDKKLRMAVSLNGTNLYPASIDLVEYKQLFNLSSDEHEVKENKVVKGNDDATKIKELKQIIEVLQNELTNKEIVIKNNETKTVKLENELINKLETISEQKAKIESMEETLNTAQQVWSILNVLRLSIDNILCL